MYTFVLAAEPWGALLADFDEIVVSCCLKAHVLASEIRNTAHLPEPSSIGLKMSHFKANAVGCFG